MIIDQTNYLDLGRIITFEVIGNVALMLFIGYLVIAIIGMKFRIPFSATFGLGIVWTAAMITWVYNPMIWGLVLLIVALIGYGT